MILEDFQKLAFERNYYNPTSKEKFKGYYYNILELTSEILKLDEVLEFNYTNTEFIIHQIGKSIASSILLLKELNFPINTVEFSLEEYKQQIKSQSSGHGAIDHRYYILPMRFSVGRLNNTIKNTISNNKQELSSTIKMEILNEIYFILVNTFGVANFLGFNIDIILEKYIESLPLPNKEKGK